MGPHRVQPPRYAKVDQLDIAVRLKHDVRRLEVTVNDRRSPAMQVGYDVAQGDSPGQYLLPWQSMSGIYELIFQIVATHILHHQIVLVVVDEPIKDFCKRRMIQ